MVHPVFHVSLLKQVKGNVPEASMSLPPQNTPMQVPEMILDRRLKNIGKRAVWQVLVKWQGWPAELATWVEEDIISTACGQAVFQDEGNVRNSDGEDVNFEEEGDGRKLNTKRVRRPNVLLAGPEWQK